MSEENMDVGATGTEEGPAPEIVAEAEDQGWVPLEKWHGKEEDWVPADRFVERGRAVNKLLNKALDKERAKTRKLEEDLIALKGTVAGLAEYRAKLEKTVYKQAMDDLKAQLRNARAAGDTEGAAAVEEQLDSLKENPPKLDTPPAQAAAPAIQQHPAVAAWMAVNPWYNADVNPEMVEYADGVTMNAINRAKASGAPINVEELLTSVTARVKKMFPAKTPASAAMFEGPGQGGTGTRASSGGSKTFATLPPEAKKEFKRFYDSGYYPNMKVEEAQVEYFNVYTNG